MHAVCCGLVRQQCTRLIAMSSSSLNGLPMCQVTRSRYAFMLFGETLSPCQLTTQTAARVAPRPAQVLA